MPKDFTVKSIALHKCCSSQCIFAVNRQMGTVNFQLQAVLDKFPDHQELVRHLYYKDMEFRSICEEYYLAIAQLNKFKKEFSEKIESVGEYERALYELEKELAGCITSNK
jgi:DNA repair ATPase RecN